MENLLYSLLNNLKKIGVKKMYYQSASADTVVGIAEFMVNYVDPLFIKLKDKWFPPSQKTLDKRLTGYSYLLMSNFKGALPIIKDALAKGANPNVTIDKLDENWNKTGKEPLLVRATRNGTFDLVEALVAANADITAPDSSGKSAMAYASRSTKFTAALKSSASFNGAAPKDTAQGTPVLPTTAPAWKNDPNL